ncbi:hypothetical protein EGC86_00675 [Shewanella frigidimarina]|uniref:hypothetical protein n=1 Tax=Shewanella frigidimarina TaxID=56812 RepID=UPI000F50FAB2|nr:hypothetical protein [Shewanella frigidimarina]RPA63825.1 hypothetical protein EGC86_00675 [Shewanella frigidimarina]
MTQLIIPAASSQIFLDIVDNLNKKESDNCISVFINAKANKATYIGGIYPEYMLCDVALEPGHGLKNSEFAIPRDFFINMKSVKFGYGQAYITPHILHLSYENGHYTTVQFCLYLTKDTLTKSQDYLPMDIFDLDVAHQKHIEYFKANSQRAFHPVSVTTLQYILNETQHYIPLEFIQFNSEKRELRYQRNGKVNEKMMPEHIKPPFSFALTQHAATQLTQICNNTEGSEIEICVEGDAISFKSPEQSMTCILSDIELFYQRDIYEPQTVLDFQGDLWALKMRNDALWKQQEIKAANQCMLFIEENEMFICSILDHSKLFKPIATNISTKGSLLFAYCPKALSELYIKNMLNMTLTRATLTKDKQGEYKLNIYRDLQDRLPYGSIELKPEQPKLKQYQALKRKYDETHGNRFIIQPEPSEKQGQLAFEEVVEDPYGFEED